ncbi:SixA phosphatase family protein [Marinicauda salina]|nr:histidine phosphatase family protein [Marinicauda salina]
MPVIILVRHAKAVDRMDAEDDFERGLTERGRADADRAGAALAGAGLKADRALVSPSRRTRETWARIAPALGDPAVDDPMALYHASQDMLERAAREAFADGAERIVLVGHNPGIGAFVHGLAAAAGDNQGLPRGWPTAAAAAFAVDAAAPALRARERVLLFNPKEC